MVDVMEVRKETIPAAKERDAAAVPDRATGATGRPAATPAPPPLSICNWNGR
jgi:hypothetical protein